MKNKPTTTEYEHLTANSLLSWGNPPKLGRTVVISGNVSPEIKGRWKLVSVSVDGKMQLRRKAQKKGTKKEI